MEDGTRSRMLSPSSKVPPNSRIEDLIERVIDFFVIVAAFVFVYFFFELILLIFCSILIAVLLAMLAAPFEKWLKLHRWAATTLAVLILTGLVGAAGYLFGTRLAVDLQDVLTRMGRAQTTLQASLQSSGKTLLSQLHGVSIPAGEIATSIFSISANVIAGMVVAVISGVFLAAQPSLYLNGFLMLFPRERRPYAEETARAVLQGLWRWLEGQFISMFLIGLLSLLAAWAIGLPSPVALGLIAGVTEFIPYVGPIIAAIPALLVAATQSPDAVLWTLAAYAAIHLSEGNLIDPLIQRQMVYVPPAIMLLGIAALTTIFGTSALLFAAPFVVVMFVLVTKLYVRDSLGEPAPLPGEPHR